MQLHAVRGRAVTLICGGPTQKTRGWTFGISLFLRVANGHGDRWPPAERNRTQIRAQAQADKTGFIRCARLVLRVRRERL